jgi:hypothetical protein
MGGPYKPPNQVEAAMNGLLTAIALWLSTNFGLPASHDLPELEYVPAAQIAALRYRGLAGSPFQNVNAPVQPGQRELVSVYDDAKKTIYLPQDWMADSPAELSVLVHEMVHHLQNVGRQKFACPEEREQLAYEAQERWLGLFQHNLQDDFQIDPFTLLVSTKCFH